MLSEERDQLRLRAFLRGFVFVTGAAVMGLEMAASRLLAPYFGTSMLVWSNLIGLILLGLTAGYFAGGQIADRWPRPQVLLGITMAAGLLTAAIPLWARPAFSAMAGVDLLNAQATVVIGSFAAAASAFLPPVFLLGCVSPFALRLYTRDVGSTGRSGGALYAISTAGSLAGIFVTTFGLIPAWGTRWTLGAWALLLVGASAVGLLGTTGRRASRVGIPLVVLAATAATAALAWSSAAGPARPRPGLLAERESLYQFVQVAQDGAGSRYLLVNEGGGIQSIYRPDSVFTEMYFDFMALSPVWVPESGSRRRVLILGYAGGTVARQMLQLLRPAVDLEVVGVEIDPAVVELGRRFLEAPDGDPGDPARGQVPVQVQVADARTYLQRTTRRGSSVEARSERFDVVVIDAYSRELYVPFHLVTREFFEEVLRVLGDNGLVVVNVNSTSPDGPLLAGIARTLAEVFPHVYVAPAGYFNYLLIGGQRPGRFEAQEVSALAPAARRLAQEFAARVQVFHPDPQAPVFTDDRAPVEFLTDLMVLRHGLTGEAKR